MIKTDHGRTGAIDNNLLHVYPTFNQAKGGYRKKKLLSTFAVTLMQLFKI